MPKERQNPNNWNKCLFIITESPQCSLCLVLDLIAHILQYLKLVVDLRFITSQKLITFHKVISKTTSEFPMEKINQHEASSPTVLLGSHYTWEVTTNPFFSLSGVNHILYFQVKPLDATLLDSSTTLLAQGENLFYALHTLRFH